MPQPQRLIVGISGATGIIYGARLLELLKETGIETHLVVSRAADLTRAHELELSAAALRGLASVSYGANDVGAALSSGSFRTAGMVILPCSMRTLAEIATGVTSTLLTRAADVVLKERRRLVLLVRETPLHAIHLRNMLSVTECGAIVMPPVPAFYTRPQTIDDMVTDTVCRVLDLFDIDVGRARRWGEDIDTGAATV
ncbi:MULTISPECIES: UbiX family flavin prenyltransferase [Methylococcus]|jgi:4-hydroxy-3-polyprenylbenzoate decarboxylase|uniref:Flavin prenyltransferase UbiX n=1 Tax=Methylococcus capsulatus TaxID=414 RepID=A0AA35XWY7_METCP|nr:UbiX family flavin prenyltransferase [Methylococcus capsulatus]QXP88037.1 UbiX family flavin prenyltransferase [Methylococcus capsulatus]QXP94951.1 UbiX family flavin prenyltransferase [Methylococcus capsulatus]UQN13065.1 UbiX family flavin prenyltransferase [Methylococcus capsulatus]CAI8718608.1 flavin prenyltransferase [Methylococcus capsulatus]